MRIAFMIIILILSAVVYLFLINGISSFIKYNDFSSSENNQEENLNSQSTNLDFGMGSKAAVSVVAPRWYGTIHKECYENGCDSSLSIFGAEILPLKVQGVNLAYVHGIYVIGAIASVFGYLIFSELKADKTERRLSEND